jgi:predicted nucleotidyltransferase
MTVAIAPPTAVLTAEQLALPPDVARVLERFSGALEQRFGSRTRELKLFGSRVRGDAHEDSDVDLLVVVDDLSESERGEVFDLAWAAAAAEDEFVVLAPIPYSTQQVAEQRRREKRLLREIDAHGVPLWRAS